MKNYKDFEKCNIGDSDIATLILVGYKNDCGLVTTPLHFGIDGSYKAYIVEAEVEIGKHYKKLETFNAWMKIYDDDMLVKTFKAKEIIVYRAAEMGCIIQLLN